MAVIYTNLVTNPSLEVDAVGWAVVLNGSIARSTAQAYVGTASLALTAVGAGTTKAQSPTFPVTVGAVHTAQVRVRANTTGRSVMPELRYYTASMTHIANVSGVAVDDTNTGWLLYTVTGTAPATAAFAAVGVQVASAAAGEVHYIDAAMATSGSVVLPYFDGATPDTTHNDYGWTGTAHGSTSTRALEALVGTLFPASTRVSVSLDWSDATPDPASALIERVNEDGSVIPVRGADPATLVAGAWIGDDYEAPLDATFYYRATSTDVPGVVLTSATYEMSSDGQTWLKHPGRPFFNMIVNVASPPELVRPITQGVFDVLGRSRPVAVSMRRSSERGTLQLVTNDEAQRVALWAMLDDGSPLFLSTPQGYGVGNIYIACGDVAEQRATKLGKEPTRYWTLPFTVVDRPSGAALALGNSWSDVLGAYASWSQLLETEGTWTGVLEGIEGD